MNKWPMLASLSIVLVVSEIIGSGDVSHTTPFDIITPPPFDVIVPLAIAVV